MLKSDYRSIAAITFPRFSGRQHYMHEIDLAAPVMGLGLEDYTDAVQALCKASGVTHGRAYVTVDEKIVRAGASQRRPLPHVDGCFMPAMQRWSHPGPAWSHAAGLQRMPVIVAASVSGCKAWRGVIDAQPTSAGDLSHIADHIGDGELLHANTAYLLSSDCIHESLRFVTDTQRSFIRIALPA